MKYANGQLRLEDKIIDFREFEVRPIIKDDDLYKIYDEFCEHAYEIRDFFDSATEFHKALDQIAITHKPKIIARETKMPSAFNFKYMENTSMFNANRRLNDEYFIGPQVTFSIRNIKIDEIKPNEKLRMDIAEKMSAHPNVECLIEIPDNTNLAKATEGLYHESIHYLITRYLINTGRKIVNNSDLEKVPDELKYIATKMVEEHFVEQATDKILSHYPDAQFERRWTEHKITKLGAFQFYHATKSIPTGIILGSSFGNPENLIFLPIPYLVANAGNYFHKNYLIKPDLMKPRKYDEFKI